MPEEAPTITEIFQSIAAGQPEDGLTPEEILLRLLFAVMIGSLIGFVYRYTYTGRKVRASMPHTLLLLCLGGALVWLVVGNNLVRAFGLAGTIGLIRYRTRVNNPKDTTILLFSMIMGMACGLGQYMVAIIGTFVVLAVLVMLQMGTRMRKRKARAFRPPPPIDPPSKGGRPARPGDDGPGGLSAEPAPAEPAVSGSRPLGAPVDTPTRDRPAAVPATSTPVRDRPAAVPATTSMTPDRPTAVPATSTPAPENAAVAPEKSTSASESPPRSDTGPALPAAAE